MKAKLDLLIKFQTRIIIAALVILFSLSNIYASTIYLKDGSLIKGTVVGATAQDVQVNTADGVLRISADRVLRIDYSDNATPNAPETTPPINPAPPAPAPQPTARRLRRAPPREPIEPLAEPEGTHQEFSLEFGAASPLSRVSFASAGGGTDDNGNSGLLLGAQYLYRTNPRLAFGLNIESMNRGSSDSHGLLPQSDTQISGNSFLLMPVLKYTIVDRGWTRPYFLAGIGVNRTSTLIDARPNFGFLWSDTLTDETRTLVDDSHWGLATTARLGIDFLQFNPSFFSFEIGWTGISNGSYSATPAGQSVGLNNVTGNLSYLTVGGKWGWRF